MEREEVQVRLSYSLPDYLGGRKKRGEKQTRSAISLVSTVIFQHANKIKDHDMNKPKIGQYHENKVTKDKISAR